MKKWLARVMTAILAVTLLPQSFMKSEVKAAVTLQNPRIVTDSSMTAGQKVTYDCVWFGSYPQTEIVDQASTSGVYGKAWAQNSDYEENSSLYTSLKNASGWDSNGDVTLNGTKYRRLKSSDATFSTTSDYHYAWNSSDTYHYFRYEPIKWRVLDVTNNQALLLADKGLDSQRYNMTNVNITWQTSTIRSWLNGYSSSTNSCNTDYTSKNFINSAFSSKERESIDSTNLDNKTTGQYSESYGGDNTTDKVFLLSSYDMFNSNKSASYGFYQADYSKRDEARRSTSSTYAKAMGVWAFTKAGYLGTCYWWLRSPWNSADRVAMIGDIGYLHENGDNVASDGKAVRPALNLNLSSFNSYSYAGTVCSDGTVKEEKTPILDTYTVAYNANGGEGAPSSQIKIEGSNLTLSTEGPTRDGYTFMGWGTSSSSTTVSYNKGGIYSKDANITLYAIWKKTLTLSYNANGGSEAPSTQNGDMFNAESSINLTISSAQPTRNNYIFLGWSIDSNATSASYTGGNTISISKDTILYAVWQEIPSTGYTVSYNANGGEGAPSPQTKEAGVSITLSKTKPTRNGYEFIGWSIDNTSTNINYSIGDTYSKDEDLILYAIWKKTITLTYNANGGSGIPSEQSATVYNATENYTFTISNISPSRTGYFFRGWGLSSNAESAAYMNGESITISADTMLYAVWEKDSQSGGETGDDEPDDPAPQPVIKKAQSITASSKTVPINNATFSLGAKTSGDGRLTYRSSNTKVVTISNAGKVTIKGYGIATITITAMETSTYKKATKAVTITIVPKKMKLKSVKSPKKGQLQVVWVKDKAADGYQIQISRDVKFKAGVFQKSTSKKLSKLKKPVTSLISKKRYYVRIRSYKKVSGKKLYGIWSYGKVIKIK